MNITKAKYISCAELKTNTSIVATIDSAEMFVPLDPDNRHYQAILEDITQKY